MRKMRGCAQSHLIEAEDGYAYVVKFLNNPQHRRVLVNEWIASAILHHIGIQTPDVEIVKVDSTFLNANPEVYMQSGSRRIPVLEGLHFGSRYAGNPHTAAYDYLPDTLLTRISNLHELIGVLIFDKWTGNADSRQAVFVRTGSAGNQGFVAHMIDNGCVFGGSNWRFADSVVQGLYFQRKIYEAIRDRHVFDPWLERIAALPREVVDRAVDTMPRSWIEGDEKLLKKVLVQLMRRKSRVDDLIQQTLAELFQRSDRRESRSLGSCERKNSHELAQDAFKKIGHKVA